MDPPHLNILMWMCAVEQFGSPHLKCKIDADILVDRHNVNLRSFLDKCEFNVDVMSIHHISKFQMWSSTSSKCGVSTSTHLTI